METQFGKNHGEGKNNLLFSRGYNEFYGVTTLWQSQIIVRQWFEEDGINLLWGLCGHSEKTYSQIAF